MSSSENQAWKHRRVAWGSNFPSAFLWCFFRATCRAQNVLCCTVLKFKAVVTDIYDMTFLLEGK